MSLETIHIDPNSDEILLIQIVIHKLNTVAVISFRRVKLDVIAKFN